MVNTQDFFREKAVLITGASSGIGKELAWQLSQAGAKLTLAARRRGLLDALPPQFRQHCRDVDIDVRIRVEQFS